MNVCLSNKSVPTFSEHALYPACPQLTTLWKQSVPLRSDSLNTWGSVGTSLKRDLIQERPYPTGLDNDPAAACLDSAAACLRRPPLIGCEALGSLCSLWGQLRLSRPCRGLMVVVGVGSDLAISLRNSWEVALLWQLRRGSRNRLAVSAGRSVAFH